MHDFAQTYRDQGLGRLTAESRYSRLMVVREVGRLERGVGRPSDPIVTLWMPVLNNVWPSRIIRFVQTQSKLRLRD